LREVEGLRYEEIAKILGLSIGAVKGRLNRARVELAMALEAHNE
jgi:RNA polymerase sigma-70 factor (ECF subfamily)